MKALFLVALVATALASAEVTAESECECPQTVLALLEGKATVVSGGQGTLSSVPCCEKKLLWKGHIDSKHTPGDACKSAAYCATCTLLDFCVWSRGDCRDINHLEVHEMHLFSHTCDRAPYEPAEITTKLFRDSNNPLSKPKPFTQTADFPAGTVTEAPKQTFTPPIPGIPENLRKMYSNIPAIAGSGPDWPHEFNGYLGPASCHTKLEVPPRERPECEGHGDDGSMAFIFPQWLHDKHCPCRGQNGCGCAQVGYVAAEPDKYREQSLV